MAGAAIAIVAAVGLVSIVRLSRRSRGTADRILAVVAGAVAGAVAGGGDALLLAQLHVRSGWGWAALPAGGAVAAAMFVLLAGRRRRAVMVGPYRLEGVLGSGATGTVFLGVDGQGTKVALKVLVPQWRADSKVVARFRDEAAAMRRIDHPSVVRVVDLIDDGRVIAIATELVNGATLRAVLRHAGRLSGPQMVVVMRGVLSGLGALHQSGLVHRDVKPENVLVDRDGVAKVADFGLARDITALSTGGELAGSPAYMSPEQIRGLGIDTRSDLYSCGAVVFELLTGQPVFVGETPQDVMRRHRDHPPSDPRGIAPDISEDLSAVVTETLAKEPTDRFQTATGLLAALESAAGQPDEDTRAAAIAVGAAVAAVAGAGAGTLAFGSGSGSAAVTAKLESLQVAGTTVSPPSRPSVPGRAAGTGSFGQSVVAAAIALAVAAAIAGAHAVAIRHPVPLAASRPLAAAHTNRSLASATTLPAKAPTWSTGHIIDANSATAGALLESVSCPTITFCAAVDDNGSVFMYDNGSWSPGERIDTATQESESASVSCATTAFCVMVDGGGDAFSYSDGTWSTGQQVANLGPLYAVACPTQVFCVALGARDDAYTFSNGVWSNARQVDSASDIGVLNAISCPTSTFCTAVDSVGNQLTFTNGSWTPQEPVVARSTPNLVSVSCPTSTFCVAEDDRGYVYTYSEGGWSPGQQIDAHGYTGSGAVSCPTPAFCAAVDNSGYAYIFASGQWSAGQQIDPDPNGSLAAISCPSAAFCVAQDTRTGEAFTFAASTSGSTTTIPTTTTPPSSGSLPEFNTQSGPPLMPAVKPSMIQISGDTTNIISNIKWTEWNDDIATGYGTVGVESCSPTCAGGTDTPTPVTIYLSNPVDGLFTTFVEHVQGFPDYG